MDREQLTRILKQQLSSWNYLGVTHFPRPNQAFSYDFLEESRLDLPPNGATLVRENATPAAARPTAPLPQKAPLQSTPKRSAPLAPPSSCVDVRPYVSEMSADLRAAELSNLSVQVAACSRCDILSKCRKQTVFGVGSTTARLCFLGEAPGADEDRLGEPFVGAAGQLLDRILEACHLSRNDVYILNTIKCRPPQNRTPAEIEQANCWDYAEQQLEILQPEFICCLGRVAAQALLKTDLAIGRLRGAFHQYRGSKVIVTYHPAYLLRTPSAKKQTWDDMKMLMNEMGNPV